MMNPQENQYANITTAVATTVATGRGILHSLTVNTTAAGTITIADGTNTIAVIKSSVVPKTFWYDVTFSKNLVVTPGAASDITVAYSQG